MTHNIRRTTRCMNPADTSSSSESDELLRAFVDPDHRAARPASSPVADAVVDVAHALPAILFRDGVGESDGLSAGGDSASPSSVGSAPAPRRHARPGGRLRSGGARVSARRRKRRALNSPLPRRQVSLGSDDTDAEEREDAGVLPDEGLPVPPPSAPLLGGGEDDGGGVKYRSLIPIDISESSASDDGEDGDDGPDRQPGSVSSRSGAASSVTARRDSHRLRRRTPFCFLCWFGTQPGDRGRDPDMNTLELMMTQNLLLVEPGFLVAQIQDFYNRKLRDRIPRRQLRREWHRRTIWQHITHHRMDPRFVTMSTARALNTMRMQLEESGLCMAPDDGAPEGARRLDTANARTYLSIVKALAGALSALHAPAPRGAINGPVNGSGRV